MDEKLRSRIIIFCLVSIIIVSLLGSSILGVKFMKSKQNVADPSVYNKIEEEESGTQVLESEPANNQTDVINLPKKDIFQTKNEADNYTPTETPVDVVGWHMNYLWPGENYVLVSYKNEGEIGRRYDNGENVLVYKETFISNQEVNVALGLPWSDYFSVFTLELQQGIWVIREIEDLW